MIPPVHHSCIDRLANAVEAFMTKSDLPKSLEVAFGAIDPLAEDAFPTPELLNLFRSLLEKRSKFLKSKRAAEVVKQAEWSQHVCLYTAMAGTTKHWCRKKFWELFLAAVEHNLYFADEED